MSGQRRARAHKAHITRQNAPQLRQLVQTAFAQETADRCQKRIRITEQMGGKASKMSVTLFAILINRQRHIVTESATHPSNHDAYHLEGFSIIATILAAAKFRQCHTGLDRTRWSRVNL